MPWCVVPCNSFGSSDACSCIFASYTYIYTLTGGFT